jgi:TolA-binding protein
MIQDEIIEMARQAGFGIGLDDPIIYAAHERFAKLVAEHERDRIKQANAPEIERVNAHIKELQGQIETLHAMYELASKQRDYLMEQQNAQVATMKGAMQ